MNLVKFLSSTNIRASLEIIAVNTLFDSKHRRTQWKWVLVFISFSFTFHLSLKPNNASNYFSSKRTNFLNVFLVGTLMVSLNIFLSFGSHSARESYKEVNIWSRAAHLNYLLSKFFFSFMWIRIENKTKMKRQLLRLFWTEVL